MYASPETESRDAVIGMDTRNLLFVVHIAKNDDSIRIIRARRATRNDRQFYED
ncbi:MAG: BrnT family toxin [Gammaproteobacteria bacterium]